MSHRNYSYKQSGRYWFFFSTSGQQIKFVHFHIHTFWGAAGICIAYFKEEGGQCAYLTNKITQDQWSECYLASNNNFHCKKHTWHVLPPIINYTGNQHSSLSNILWNYISSLNFAFLHDYYFFSMGWAHAVDILPTNLYHTSNCKLTKTPTLST